MKAAELRRVALSLADVEEVPHFDRAAFRTPARIFATLGSKGVDCNVRLPPEVQQVLVDSKPEVFTRLNGAWGAGGWTRIDVVAVDAATCREVLKEAHAYAGTKAKAKTKTKTKVDAKRKTRSKKRGV